MDSDELPPGHKLRVVDRGLVAAEAAVVPREPAVWEQFGSRLLGFHHRVGMTAMCRCGETVIACSVLASARDLGLLPPLQDLSRYFPQTRPRKASPGRRDSDAAGRG